MSNVYRNKTSFYATYTSGIFNAFYATEAEAIKHIENPENGAEFNGTWFQDRYMKFSPKETVLVNNIVYSSNSNDAICHKDSLHFVEWELAE